MDRPNVLCVVLDTARRDAFEPYGAPAGSTPATAQLASSGRALPGVYATASWTVPSHASMFTGSLPRALGLGQAPGGRREGCRPVLEANRERVLPEVLRRDGYATAAVSANVWITEASGFASVSSEIVARVTEKCFHSLAAPVRRVTAFDIPFPPPKLEKYQLPSVDRILDAVDDLQWEDS